MPLGITSIMNITPFYESLFGDETVTQRKNMLSRTDNISGFHLKVSRQERQLYEEFCNSAEAELLREMRDYFVEAKQKTGVINLDRLGMWSKIQNPIYDFGELASGDI